MKLLYDDSLAIFLFAGKKPRFDKYESVLMRLSYIYIDNHSWCCVFLTLKDLRWRNYTYKDFDIATLSQKSLS